MSLNYIAPELRLEPGAWWTLLILASSAIPGVFMLYCYYLFEDHAKPPIVLIVLLLLSLVLGQIGFQFPALFAWFGDALSESIANRLFYTLPELLQLFFAALAVFWVARGWREDLVESRRRLRSVVVTVQAVTILVVLVMENYFLSNEEVQYSLARDLIQYAICFFSFATLVALLNFDYTNVEKVLGKVSSNDGDELAVESLASEVAVLDKVLKSDKVYREHGLTIAKLASIMDLPEYRLRALINKHLGYRNFNALLHEYRIDDACHMLSEKGAKNLPILTIALTVGYQSITPFNNAFRQLKGVTPTEYRKSMSA